MGTAPGASVIAKLLWAPTTLSPCPDSVAFPPSPKDPAAPQLHVMLFLISQVSDKRHCFKKGLPLVFKLPSPSAFCPELPVAETGLFTSAVLWTVPPAETEAHDRPCLVQCCFPSV